MIEVKFKDISRNPSAEEFALLKIREVLEEIPDQIPTMVSVVVSVEPQTYGQQNYQVKVRFYGGACHGLATQRSAPDQYTAISMAASGISERIEAREKVLRTKQAVPNANSDALEYRYAV